MVEDSKQNDIKQEYDGKNDKFQKFHRIGEVCFEIDSDHRGCNHGDYKNDHG